MWTNKLQDDYVNFDEFKAYSDIYNLAGRLGFATVEEAWKKNPLIQGSTDPRDFKIVSQRGK